MAPSLSSRNHSEMPMPISPLSLNSGSRSLSKYAVPLPCQPNHLRATEASPCSVTLRKHRLVSVSCEHQKDGDHGNTHRRNVLLSFAGLSAVAAAGLGTEFLMAAGGPTQNSDIGVPPLQEVPEFGSKPRPLDKPIRALVPRHKKSRDKSNGGNPPEVLVIDGIDIPNDEPVRFDVYVAKAHGDRVGPDLGEFAGSMVDLARIRVGRNPSKGSLELGITGLVKEIEAEDCEKVAVTLVPRTGEVIIGGLHIE